MFGKNITALFKKAKEMKEQMGNVKEELESMEITADAGGGMVEVTANGTGVIIDIDISPECIDAEEKEFLETMVMSAVNSAKRKAEKEASKYMKSMTGGLSLSNILDSADEIIGEDTT